MQPRTTRQRWQPQSCLVARMLKEHSSEEELPHLRTSWELPQRKAQQVPSMAAVQRQRWSQGWQESWLVVEEQHMSSRRMPARWERREEHYKPVLSSHLRYQQSQSRSCAQWLLQ